MTSPNHPQYCRWKAWSSESFGSPERALGVYFAKELKLCGFNTLRDLRVLEIGFGNGKFAVWARKAGASYTGTEAIPELLALAHANGFDAHPADAPLGRFIAAESLDLIVAFDVFEHMDLGALRRMLIDLRGTLAPHGRLIARVPSGDSPFARAIQHGDLTHRTALGSSAVRQLAQETGFEISSIRAPAWPLLGMGVRAFVRRSLVAMTRAILYPLITHALMGSGQPVLAPNILFVFQRPRLNGRQERRTGKADSLAQAAVPLTEMSDTPARSGTGRHP